MGFVCIWAGGGSVSGGSDSRIIVFINMNVMHKTVIFICHASNFVLYDDYFAFNTYKFI